MFSSGAFVGVLLAATMPQQPCTTNAPQVVDDIYKQVLERPADPASAAFSYALGSGRTTVRDIVVELAQSEEHLDRFFRRPLVDDIYRQTLNRPPAAEEQAAATRQLAGGMPVNALIASIAIRSAGSEQQAVEILYRRLLGREPDPDGLRANVALAQRDGVASVVRTMMSSPEYRARAEQPGAMQQELAAYTAGIRVLYQHMLDRPPDPGGLESMAQIAAVYGLPEVAHRIGTSREYLAQWGEQAVPGTRGVRFCAAAGETERRAPGTRAVPRQRFP